MSKEVFRKNNKVLRIISSLDPKYGGPARAIIESSLDLINKGFDVEIVTHDLKNSNFFKSKKIKVINLGPSYGNYRFNIKIFFWLLKNRNRYDHFIIHGIWQINTLFARILLYKKFYVFIHGQLNPYYLQEEKFKSLKKKSIGF